MKLVFISWNLSVNPEDVSSVFVDGPGVDVRLAMRNGDFFNVEPGSSESAAEAYLRILKALSPESDDD